MELGDGADLSTLSALADDRHNLNLQNDWLASRGRKDGFHNRTLHFS
jgi:hypothetical protein